MNPEISVIIPTYNSEGYIAQALKSVFNQTYRNFEIILVDDASSDSTVDIALSFGDQRLKIIKNKRNRGVSHARNCGIKQAQGRWIALLDSDDWYAPKRLESLLSVANKRCADLVADNLFLIQDQEREPWSTLLEKNKKASSSVRLIDAAEFASSDRLSPIVGKRCWSLGYTKPMIRREFLVNHGIAYNEDINIGEDFTLYLECLRHQGRFYLVPEAHYYYRTRTVSLSTRKPQEYLSQSCAITQNFILQERRLSSNGKLLEALDKNLIVFKRRIAYQVVMESIKRKKMREAYQQLILEPSIVVDIVNKLLYVMENKLAFMLVKNFRPMPQSDFKLSKMSHPKKQTLTSDMSN